jgi:hypothetical protein
MRCCTACCCAAQVEGEAQSFLDHIRLGIETAAKDPAALLLFSGGQTRKAAGPRSEGLSYWLVAEAADWFGHPDVRPRAYTEVCMLQACLPTAYSMARISPVAYLRSCSHGVSIRTQLFAQAVRELCRASYGHVPRMLCGCVLWLSEQPSLC